MIVDVTGDILDDDADVLVNPVNCVGVMGAGLALQFKHRFDFNYFDSYVTCCDSGYMNLGGVLWWSSQSNDPDIISFPTKHHWRDKSELRHIEEGLDDMACLANSIPQWSTIAVPMLGCGLGGLDKGDVYDLMVEILEPEPQVYRIYRS